MYVKVVQDTLKTHLCRDYSRWAMSCGDEQPKFAGYNIYVKDSDVIDQTLIARETYTYMSEYLVIIGTSKQGKLAMDYNGNLYNCGKTLRRIDKTFKNFVERLSA